MTEKKLNLSTDVITGINNILTYCLISGENIVNLLEELTLIENENVLKIHPDYVDIYNSRLLEFEQKLKEIEKEIKDDDSTGLQFN